MTLGAMIRSHNDAALETLTSKGLVRRAQRDLELGKAVVQSAGENLAVVAVDGETVALNGEGPQASSCTCKAHGVCRHIVLAIMLMRQEADSIASADTKAYCAVNELCAMTSEQIAEFAGADWNKASALAAADLPVIFEEKGPSLTVRLPELDATVTFIAGGKLQGAAFKGPKTKKRLLTVVAALLLRRREGDGLADIPEGAAASGAGVPAEFIDSAQRVIEQGVAAVLPSRSPLGNDLFLDLAVSSRCESLPRLSAELRALAAQARLAGERHVNFEPAAFVKDAARSYALLEGLRLTPSDPLLTGSVRRDYTQMPGIDVWPLGVSRWRSLAGARGLSAYIYDPGTSRWLTVLEGRSAEMDVAFDAGNAYEMPVWGVGTMRRLMGRRVKLPSPRIAKDGSLSGAPQPDAEVSGDNLPLREVLACNAVRRCWSDLKSDLATRLGAGIRRRATPQPALIAPTGFGRISFNDLSQSYDWEVHDEKGAALLLSVAAVDDESAMRLWRLGKRIQALVVEASLGKQGLEVRPVSVLLRERESIAVLNIGFDAWPTESALKKAVSSVGERLAKPLTRSDFDVGPVNRAVADVADYLVDAISRSPTANIAALTRRLETCGLVSLANALDNLSVPNGVRCALKAGYIASEIQAIQAFE